MQQQHNTMTCTNLVLDVDVRLCGHEGLHDIGMAFADGKGQCRFAVLHTNQTDTATRCIGIHIHKYIRTDEYMHEKKITIHTIQMQHKHLKHNNNKHATKHYVNINAYKDATTTQHNDMHEPGSGC